MTLPHLETMIRNEIALVQLKIENLEGLEDNETNLEEQTGLRNDLARLYHKYYEVTGRAYEEEKT